MQLKCPFFPNEIDPCNTHQCLFYRNSGCAIVLAATISDKNQRKIEELKRESEEIVYKTSNIEQKVDRLEQGLSR